MYQQYDPDEYVTKRNDAMRYPERPEGTRLIFYNLHLPGKDGRPGTPVGVVALLVSENLERTARGVAVRSLMDAWDPGEGRIRAAGRAIRAYYRYYDSDNGSVFAEFNHPHAAKVTQMHKVEMKYGAPVVLTAREYKIVRKRFSRLPQGTVVEVV